MDRKAERNHRKEGVGRREEGALRRRGRRKVRAWRGGGGGR